MTFDICTTIDRIEIEQGKTGEIPFTITNKDDGEAIKTGFKTKCDGEIKNKWCTIEDSRGESLFTGKNNEWSPRNLDSRDGLPVVLKVTVPKETSIGSSKVSLIAYSTLNPGTVFNESNPVNVVVKEKPIKKFHWKWVAIGAGCVLVLVVSWLIIGAFFNSPDKPNDLVAKFALDKKEGVLPLEVKFTDESVGQKGDEEFSPIQWEWDFGDGNTSTDQHPSHVYKAAGTYSVALVATWPAIDEEDDNKVASKLFAATVGEACIKVYDPVTAKLEAIPESGHSPLTVIFHDLSYGQIKSRTIEFGDGTESIALQTGQYNIPHDYINNTNLNKTLTARLTIEDGTGNKMNADKEIIVFPKSKAVMVMSLDKNMKDVAGSLKYNAPCTVYFKDESVGANNPLWDFGDGSTKIGKTVSHKYEKKGNYTVTLSSGGNQATGTIILYDEPKLTFTLRNNRKKEVKPNETVHFDYTIKGDFLKWTIYFGDGDHQGGTRNSGTAPHVYRITRILFGDQGTSKVTAKLQVTGRAGTNHEKTVQLTVKGGINLFKPTLIVPKIIKINKK